MNARFGIATIAITLLLGGCRTMAETSPFQPGPSTEVTTVPAISTGHVEVSGPSDSASVDGTNLPVCTSTGARYEDSPEHQWIHLAGAVIEPWLFTVTEAVFVGFAYIWVRTDWIYFCRPSYECSL
jgi:hypothetical protein